MKIKFYISFLTLTVVMMALAYLLLSQLYKHEGWAKESVCGAGLIITVLLLVKIYQQFMKTPQEKQNR
ncbi:MAG: hypothetical protein QM791_11670 [Ferruginibacter sp.]